MPTLALFKPYGVLCRFTDQAGRPTLADYVDVPGVYPAGRLDKDSEGLLLLTDDGRLASLITHPRYKLSKAYLAQVEGLPGEEALARLRQGRVPAGYPGGRHDPSSCYRPCWIDFARDRFTWLEPRFRRLLIRFSSPLRARRRPGICRSSVT